MSDERSGIGTGIVVVTVGLLFLADHQGYASFSRLWPVLLIVLVMLPTIKNKREEAFQEEG